jgi:carbamoylphosphate synthase small subunit
MVLQLTRKLENNPDLEITHVHLNDGTVAGMKMKHKNCFFSTILKLVRTSDSSYLFDQFIENIKGKIKSSLFFYKYYRDTFFLIKEILF